MAVVIDLKPQLSVDAVQCDVRQYVDKGGAAVRVTNDFIAGNDPPWFFGG